MVVHIGHSTCLGATCGRGSKDPNKDILVSERTFYKEIVSHHRCTYCVRLSYLAGAGPEIDPAAWDVDEEP